MGECHRDPAGLDPKLTDARYDLASAEAASGEWEPAASDFRQVLKERPDDAKARQHLGGVLLPSGDELARAGSPEPAVVRYREALAYRSDDAELHTNLGVTRVQLGRFNEVQTELEAALSFDPNSEPARKALTAVQAQIKVKGK